MLYVIKYEQSELDLTSTDLVVVVCVGGIHGVGVERLGVDLCFGWDMCVWWVWPNK